jgi:hypothetical protein
MMATNQTVPLSPSWLPYQFFGLDNKGCTFIRNASKLLPDNTESYPKGQFMTCDTDNGPRRLDAVIVRSL